MNLPNKLTLLRVILIPVFLVCIYVDAIPAHFLLALIVFVRKFKLYGDLADKVHAYIVDREHKRTDGE